MNQIFGRTGWLATPIARGVFVLCAAAGTLGCGNGRYVYPIDPGSPFTQTVALAFAERALVEHGQARETFTIECIRADCAGLEPYFNRASPDALTGRVTARTAQPGVRFSVRVTKDGNRVVCEVIRSK